MTVQTEVKLLIFGFGFVIQDLSPDNSVENAPKFYSVNADGDITIDTDHPDILKAVDKAIDEVSKEMIVLPASEYITVIDEEIKKIQMQKEQDDSNASRY